ncbi:MAG: permease-like cell division protein FtsX [Thermoanaerobaculia bacterium]|nr:permease-like cell division protein FtsX [Thermoanaerobaculia bacterium]
MNLLQAFAYFVREALVGLLRSWRVSLLAVLTIAVSLFLAGGFLLTSGNLARAVATWKQEARLVVYLAENADAAAQAEIERLLREAPWVEAVAFVPPAQGAERFRAAFPSLAELVDDSRYGSLPASFEAQQRTPSAAEEAEYRLWLERLGRQAGVETLDDDRDWIDDVETLLVLVRALGTVLTGVLLGAAVFTIAAVVRLTSFLYRDEIAIMRLVGATEFFIRGPFYLEGVVQGLAGGVAAMAALRTVHAALTPRFGESIVLRLVAQEFLSWRQLAFLVAIGALAGLGGALASLGREQAASERG